MVNPLYLQKEYVKKYLPLKDYRIQDFEINHFYLRANEKMTRILFDALNSLQRKFLITYREISIIVREDMNGKQIHSEATKEEIKILDNVKYNVLEEMQLNSMIQVIFKFKTEEFYNKVTKILNEEYEIKYAYTKFEIIFTKENILHELSKIDLQQHKRELNNKVIDTINNNAKKVYDKSIEEYNNKLDEYLFNDDNIIGIKNSIGFKQFKHKDDYLDIQYELSEYLLRLDD